MYQETYGGSPIYPVATHGVMQVYVRQGYRTLGVPKYVVFHSNGEALEEFRNLRKAVKWAKDNGFSERLSEMIDVTKAKTARVIAKCSDQCSVTLMDDKDSVIARHNGYVPEFMPGEHYGDYVELDIDLETGRILNWEKPSPKIMKKPTSQSEWINP